MDFSGLSLIKLKKEEMETQVSSSSSRRAELWAGGRPRSRGHPERHAGCRSASWSWRRRWRPSACGWGCCGSDTTCWLGPWGRPVWRSSADQALPPAAGPPRSRLWPRSPVWPPGRTTSLTKRMVSTQLSSSTTRLLEGPLGRLVSRPGPCVAAPTWLRSLQGVQPPAPRPGSVSPRPPALAEPKGSGIGAVLLDMSLSATGTGENSQNLAGLSHRPAANIWNICNLS